MASSAMPASAMGCNRGTAADINNRIVSSLVTAQPRLFLTNLARWLIVAVPATYTNSMLEFLQSELALAYRTRWVAT